MPRLFERFHRVRGTRTRTHEGCGIGLALVRLWSSASTARCVAADSNVGEGSTFMCVVPFGYAAPPPGRGQQ